MNSSTTMLLVLFVSVALATICLLAIFKLGTKFLGIHQVIKDGVVMTENGLEYTGFLMLFKLKVEYADIESVELYPYHKGILKCLISYNGIRSHWIRRRMCGDIVVISLAGSRIYKFLLFTPNDAQAFVEQLRIRIMTAKTHNSLLI